jgi:transketolase
MKENLMRIALALLVMTGAAVAQDEGKKKAGPLGLPSSADLKEKCGFDDEQAKKADDVLASYKDKVAEAQKKIKEAEDKKAAMKEVGPLRAEILAKLREVCKDDEQKKKFDEATAKKRKEPKP